MRYKPVYSNKINTISMDNNLTNSGEIDSMVLKQNGSEVLTSNDCVDSINNVEDHKIPTISVVKGLLSNVVGSGGGSGISGGASVSIKNSLNSDLQTLRKEKEEISASCDILLDIGLTPEIQDHSCREELYVSYSNYKNVYNELYVFISELIDNENITDDKYESLNKIVDVYILSFSQVNKSIQIANRNVMTIKSNNVLDEANKNINEVASNISYKISIYSENGPFFRKGYIDTTLTVNVYRGREDVTENFNSLQFKWTRKSKNANSDDLWGMKGKTGKSIHITNSDYEAGGCSFICTLYDTYGRMIASSL